jgi:hypothetical protein
MFIRQFAEENFMIHRGPSLELHSISMFVGPNNVGKPALIDVLLNFSMVSRERLSQAFGSGPYSFSARRSRGVAAVMPIAYEVELCRSLGDAECVFHSMSCAREQRG